MPQPTTKPAPTSAQPPADEATRTLPLQTRAAPVSTVDETARTFDCVWTSGAPVRRFDWASWQPYLEELSLDPAHIRMGRMESGAPLLNTHRQWDLSSLMGVVQRAWLEQLEGRATIRFSDRNDEMNAYWRDVSTGIIRNISVGYIVHRYEKTDAPQAGGIPTWRAIDWEPAELSLVPVGADPFAGVRSLGGGQPTPDMRQQLIDAAAQQVGGRSFACELVLTNATRSQILMPPGLPGGISGAAATRNSKTPAAAPVAVFQPSNEELPMDELVQDRGTSTAAPADAAGTRNTAAAAPAAAPSVNVEQVLAADRERAAQIRSAVDFARRTTPGAAGLDEAFIGELTRNNSTLDQARSAIFAKLEAASTAGGPQRSAAAISTVQDEQEQRRVDMATAMSHRANPGRVQLTDSARRFRGYNLFELARRSLELARINTEGMTRSQIVGMAMSGGDDMGFRAMQGTSDFTIALASTVNRSLRDAYTSAPRSFTRWARMGTLADFRPATRVAAAGNLALEKVNEHGEFKRGKIVDSGETIQLGTYGKVVGVTRQAVINDDLDMLGRIPAMFGRAAADFESDMVYSVLTANADMSDAVALFHATHGNLAGTAAVIGETSLSAARLALRKQTDPSGNNQPLNLVGKFILVPAALETTAQKQFAAAIVATKTADTNVFQNSYEIVTEPRLDASSATAWYVLADSSQIDTVEYAYLEGEQGLYTEQRNGFDVDGLEVKARLDFAAKATDWRGIYKNAGV